MKQTAVEFLFREMERMQYFIGNDLYHAYEEAKEMEKEQIIDAYDSGLFDGSMDDINDRLYKQYYNQTFKSEQ
jgi:hypothetical protein